MDNPYQTPETLNVESNVNLGVNQTVSAEVIRVLTATKGWVRFMAVLGFIVTAFMALGSLGIMVAGDRFLGGVVTIIALFYLVFAGVNFFLALKLNRYASRIAQMLLMPSEINLVAALEAQRGFWKLVGIVAIFLISIYVLAILAGVLSDWA